MFTDVVRLSVLAALALSLGGANRQDDGVPSVPLPTTKVYQLDDNPDPNGVHSYVSVRIEWVDEGEASIFAAKCDNVCKGKKHYRHQDCDLSCDQPCTQGTHSFHGSLQLPERADETSAFT